MSATSFLHPVASRKAQLFPLSQIRLRGGLFGAQQAVHLRYLLELDADRLLAPILKQAGLPPKAEGYGGWEATDIRGHSLGHYLSALALMFAATGEAALLQRLHYIVAELERCQNQNGDGYVFAVDKVPLEKVRDGEIDAGGFTLNGVWVPFYALHKLFAGLRDAYRHAGSDEALQIELGLADWVASLFANLTPSQVQQVLTCEHGGMNEVLADLAADTGDAKYLDMAARYFHHNTVLEPMLRGEDALDGLHANTQIPKVVGLASEFELTGQASYRLAAESFWDHVVKHRSYVNGGHSEGEHFFPVEQFPQKLSPLTCETCNSYNLLKLTGHLFEWEPDADYMDFVERALINHLLANIGREGGEFGYFLGLGSVGYKTFSTHHESWWCCVGTGLENPARYGEQIYAHSGTPHDGEALWVNLYMGSELSWPERGLTLSQETNFPDGDSIRFKFTCAAPQRLELKLRHPDWCEWPRVSVNGTAIAVNSPQSTYFSIEQLWEDGDVVEVKLPMKLHTEYLSHSDDKMVAVLYGPTVLAGVVPEQPGIPNPAGERYSDHLKSRGKTDAFPPVVVTDQGAGRSADADILGGLTPTGQAFAEFYSRDLVQPCDLSFVPFYRVYEEQYAVYFPLLSATEWAEREAELRAAQERQVRLEAATLDSVTPGFQQPEVEHNIRMYNSEVLDFAGRKCRTAAAGGGWFSYELAVDPEQPLELVVTFWGGVWHESIVTIQIDGETLAVQRLRTNKPGEFFDESYPVPTAWTSGKTEVTVRFDIQWQNADSAAGVFGLRMMRANYGAASQS